MKYFLLTFLMALQAHAQQSPQIDPNKFTVCAITINSDDEKKIFQSEVNKNKAKFNPIVELTDFGDNQEWFKKACESKIRCDQLVISGHFGGRFFSHEPNGKSLSLQELEQAGCSKSCEGILSDPYEVFLLGCNTLSGKEFDNRTPAEYLQVLLHDGFSASDAEMVVQSRYGAIGDSNKGSMQRAFSGAGKNIYGFDSVGPSGKTIKPFLNKYFSKISLPEHLEKLEAKRLMNTVQNSNTELAGSLKGTSFTQCHEGSSDDPVTKNICRLQDSRISKSEKIAIMTELLATENYLTYLPAISNFLKREMYSLDEKDKAELKLLSDNQVIKGQILGLLTKTSSIGLKTEWAQLAMNLGFLNKEDASARIQKDIESLFAKPLSQQDSSTLCMQDFHVFELKIKSESIKNLGNNEISALSCLNVKDSQIIGRIAKKFETLTSPELKGEILSFLRTRDNGSFLITPQLISKVKEGLKSTDENQKADAIGFLVKFAPQDKAYVTYAIQALKSKDEENVQYILSMFGNSKDLDIGILKEVASLSKSKASFTKSSAIRILTETKNPDPIVQAALLDVLKTNDKEQEWLRFQTLEYFVAIKPVKKEIRDAINEIAVKDPSYKYYINEVLKKLD